MFFLTAFLYTLPLPPYPPLYLSVHQTSEAMVSIDMPAGPSEVLVIADSAANPAHVAIDLLSQVR